MTPEETWRAITEQVAIVAADAAVEAVRGYDACRKTSADGTNLSSSAGFRSKPGGSGAARSKGSTGSCGATVTRPSS